MQTRLEANAVIKVLHELNPEEYVEMEHTIQRMPQHIGPLELGNKTVVFSACRASADSIYTAWMVNFYQNYTADMHTMPKTDADQ